MTSTVLASVLAGAGQKESPFLWYFNRGTGLVLLVLFTLAVTGGVASTRANAWIPGRRRTLLPAFVTQQLHRSLALMSITLLLIHIFTAVMDTFVSIHWWEAIIPWGGSYRPFYLAMGAIATDLTVAVVITALLKQLIGRRTWRAIHLTSYLAWIASVIHTIGIGTDVKQPLGFPVVVICVGMVVLAGVTRMLSLRASASQAAA